MSKKLIVLCLVFGVALVAGCEQTTHTTTTTTIPLPPAPTAGGVDFFPHTDGYSWTYRSRNWTYGSSTSEGYAVYTWDGTAEVDGTIAQKLNYEASYESSRATDVYYYKISDENVLRFLTYISSGIDANDDFLKTTSVDAVIVLDFPIYVGKTWTDYGTREISVVSWEAVTVPAGTYSCLRLEQEFWTVMNSQDAYYKIITWYAENIGKVKWFWSYETSSWSHSTVEELTSKNF